MLVAQALSADRSCRRAVDASLDRGVPKAGRTAAASEPGSGLGYGGEGADCREACHDWGWWISTGSPNCGTAVAMGFSRAPIGPGVMSVERGGWWAVTKIKALCRHHAPVRAAKADGDAARRLAFRGGLRVGLGFVARRVHLARRRVLGCDGRRWRGCGRSDVRLTRDNESSGQANISSVGAACCPDGVMGAARARVVCCEASSDRFAVMRRGSPGTVPTLLRKISL